MRRFALTLNLTRDCNLACPYCYAGDKVAEAISFETAMAGVELALSARPQLLDVAFFGGEPLLEWDLLMRLVEAIEARVALVEPPCRVRFTTTTNATQLTSERIDALVAHDFEIAVSLDGVRAAQDINRPTRGGGSSFEASLRGLKLALGRIKKVTVISVLTPQSAPMMAEGVRFLFEQGARRISLNPNFYATWSEADKAALTAEHQAAADFYVERFEAGEPFYLDFIESKVITRLKGGYACGDRCDFGANEVAVAPSGRLYPCERLIGDDTGELSIGHVHEGGFDELARLKLLAEKGNHDPDCESCALKDRCMSWCGCVNYASTGRINQPGDFLCFYEQLCIHTADSAATRLWVARNPAFLKRFYGLDLGRS
ncbi:radical SAM protein [Myxococcota bacterium]|nr:radical SAM protein [Myxococcota bacterium]MBU1432449.1 radical SAM protein [Myxococcota bacterium]MBU1896636.1 radical SAM protein [Myxococcota bacterium]